jgi:iron complex transport system ATP-binding protein
MPAIEVAQATIGYRERIILRDINCEIAAGEILGIVGPNGVGKSTLVKAVSGVLPLHQGAIRIHGRLVRRLSPAERARSVAVVPQAVQLPGAFSVLQVVLMGRTPYLGWLGREGRSDQAAAWQALERTGTTHLAARPVGELSGGEQQKVLIARALAQTPRALLLDEPTAHLDLKHQDEILQLIRSLAIDGGLSVMVTLHDLNLVARFTDRVAMLSDGRIFKIGLPAEVLRPEDLAQVYGMEIHVTTHPIHGTPLVLS